MRRAVIVCVGSALVACGYPTYVFDRPAPDDDSGAPNDASTETDATPIDATDASDTRADVIVDSGVSPDTTPPPDTGPCPILSGGDICTSIPKFSHSGQTLDGDGSEFCDLKATKLVATSGADMDPTPPPGGIDTVVWIRAGWSSEGLHMHVHVDQASVFAPRTTEEIWRGDAIEVFTAGFDTLHGSFDTTTHDVGAFQVIFAPPDPAASIPMRSELFTNAGSSGTYPLFASRQVTGGYDVEMKYLWSDLHGTGASGQGVAFDLGVDVRQTVAPTRIPALQSFVFFAPDPTATSCDPVSRPNGHPSCDDLTWCRPKLE